MRDNGDYTDGIIGDHHIINGAMTLANEFNLRPLQPTDGRLINRLNEETPDGGAGQMRPLACLSSLKVHPNFRS